MVDRLPHCYLNNNKYMFNFLFYNYYKINLKCINIGNYYFIKLFQLAKLFWWTYMLKLVEFSETVSIKLIIINNNIS